MNINGKPCLLYFNEYVCFSVGSKMYVCVCLCFGRTMNIQSFKKARYEQYVIHGMSICIN